MRPSILVAGVGNVFLGDDAFGVEVVRRLPPQPTSVRVVDFGIRGLDLAYALQEPYDLVILVDALSRGAAPGTIFVLEPDLSRLEADNGTPMMEAHGMDPYTVIRYVKNMGVSLPPLRIVGCEPDFLGSDEEPAMGLSAAVEAAVPEAIAAIRCIIAAESVCTP